MTVTLTILDFARQSPANAANALETAFAEEKARLIFLALSKPLK